MATPLKLHPQIRPALKRQAKALASIWAIGRITFLEVVRERVLYNVILVAFLLLGMAFLASQATAIREERIVLDFGLSALSFSSVLMAILLGAPMLGKEFEKRTIFLILSRPVSQYSFVMGKFLGLSLVLTLNWMLLTGVYLFIFTSMGGFITPTLITAALAILLQGWLAGAMAIFLSSFATTALSVVISFGLFLVGVNMSQLRYMSIKSEDPVLSFIFDGVTYILPNYEFFYLGTKATYGQPVPLGFVTSSIGYGALWIALLMVAAGYLVTRKEI